MTEEEKIIRATIPPTTEDELWNYLNDVWGIKIPRTSVCPDHSAPFDVVCDCFFARHPVVILKGSRGIGKSVITAALAIAEQVALNVDVKIIAASEQQSKRILQMIRAVKPQYRGMFWSAKNAPIELFDKDRNNASESGIHRKHGGLINALAASENAVRGEHPARLRCDEADQMDMEILEAALGMPYDFTLKDEHGEEVLDDLGNPIVLYKKNTLISSTHHHPDGPMTELLERAEKMKYKVHSICYRECMVNNGGWITEEAMDKVRETVSPRMFRIEYELGQAGVDSRIWDPEVIEERFKGDHPLYLVDGKPGKWEGREGEEISFPPQGKNHYGGADWAKQNDRTAIACFARTQGIDPDMMMYFKSMNRLDWTYMVNQFNRAMMIYYGPAAYDCTGVGSVVEDLLTVSAEGVNFSSKSLIHGILTEYQKAIQDGKIIFPNIKWLKDAHIKASHEQFYGNQHLHDGIVACALAWYARSNGLDDINIGR